MRVAPVPSAPSPASARTTRRVLPVALSRRVARVLLVGGLVTSLAACGPESPLAKPDEPLPGAVLDAPWLVTSPDGEHVVLLTEQTVRRTEKHSRTTLGYFQEGARSFSLRRHVVWSLDPATLAVQWQHTVQEVRPAHDTVAPRITGSDGQTLWWQGPGEGALALQDGRAMPATGAQPQASEAPAWATASWQFRTGDPTSAQGPLRIPGTEAALRAEDPASHFVLHAPSAQASSPIAMQLDRVADDDARMLWSATLPVARLHGLVRASDTLVFLGMRHPNVEVPEMRMALEARQLAAELGLVGTTVIFNEEWVAYEDRQNYLLDADVAVTTHLHHIETEFSFRTRVLDYLWAGLPTVATSGDSLADLIEHEQLGLTVAPGDVDALDEALFRLLEDHTFAADCRANVAEVRSRFAWSTALRPIVEFCRRPVRSPDLASGYIDAGGFVSQEHTRESAWIRYKRVVVNLVRDGEWRLIASSAVRVSKRLLGRARP